MGLCEGQPSLAGSACTMFKLTISNVSRRGDREARSAQDERTVMVCTPKVSYSIRRHLTGADNKLRNYRRRSIRGPPMVVSKRQGQGPIVYLLAPLLFDSIGFIFYASFTTVFPLC
jgi:hypothetical protein